MSARSIDDLVDLCREISNWGRWGSEDQIGTLNHVTSERLAAGAAEIRTGATVSLALPIDGGGPQIGSFGRINPVHVMLRDGGDVVSGATVRHMYGGTDKHLRGTDDLLILPTQASTHWDGLSHVIHGDVMYNGFGAAEVSSYGAFRNGVQHASARMQGRGILLDVATHLGVASVDPAVTITPDLLDDCADRVGVRVLPGDFLFIRTGHLAERRRAGWGDFAGGPAPGVSVDVARWLHQHDIAAGAADTWCFEQIPNETPDVAQPFHLVAITYLGFWIGEMFDLESLADLCTEHRRFSFLVTAVPMPIVGGVASPVNPIAIF